MTSLHVFQAEGEEEGNAVGYGIRNQENLCQLSVVFVSQADYNNTDIRNDIRNVLNDDTEVLFAQKL